VRLLVSTVDTGRYGRLCCIPPQAAHGRLKARLRPMRGLKRLRSAGVIGSGHAFVQNLRRGHYERAIGSPAPLRLATAFAELAIAV
jgi:transposase, IS6 family